MKTISQLQQHLQNRLTEIYQPPEAAAVASQVLMHMLQLDSLQLRLQKHEPASEAVAGQTEAILERLLQHEPLQYVLGTAHFYDLELLVTPAVLIPRPETEELVNLIIQENRHRQELHIMDIGTGSGCIPVALAKNLRVAKVYGVDISEEALKIAVQNAEKYKAEIEWLKADILTDALPVAPASLDIMVSNPPYVLEHEKELMRPNVLQYEPHLALFVPDTDALRFYKRIAGVALELLNPGGSLYFEINEQFAVETVKMLQEKGFQKTAIVSDIFDKERFVKAQKPSG